MTKPSTATDGWSSDISGAHGDAARSDSVRADLIGILDTVDLPIIVVGRDFTVARFNRAATAALCLTPSNIGQPPRDIRVLADLMDLEKLCAQVIADGVPCRREVRHGDGWFLLRIAPYTRRDHQIGGIVLTLTNVTAFRASIEQVIYEREYTKAILNTVIEPLVVLDADLRVQTANRAFYAMFRVSRDETQGVPLYNLKNHDWDTPRLWTLLKATLSDNNEFQTLEVEHNLPAIGRRTLLLYARRLSREGNPGHMILLAFQDISERKQAEEVLREADRRKDEFLATLAHELRGPLAPLRNMLEIMKRADAHGDLIQQARSTMDRQLGQMTRLIDDLLDVSRISRGRIEQKRERVELASVVYQAVEACRPLAECHNHEVNVTLPPEPIHLHADPVRLAQVFGNLLNNGCKYTQPGGRIWLSAELARPPEVVVKIKDTGMGIPPDKLDSIFGMFTQVDRTLERSQGGLGIGLTLVERLVEMHGGSVEAFSEGEGRGSEFVVRLPVLIDKLQGQQPSEPTGNEQTATTTRRILVVDDNRDGATSLAMLLKLAGNETYTAHDGLEAVEAAERFRPDLVLLDIGLPKLNGRDAARHIRQQPWGKNMVLVALTGWGQEEDRRKSKDAGFDAHMVKPVDYAALNKLLVSLSSEQGGQLIG